MNNKFSKMPEFRTIPPLDTSIIRLPPPTRLYHLSPQGVNTADVESAVSYSSRLADAHTVTVGNLIKHEITPLLNKPYMIAMAEAGGTGFYKRGHSINGSDGVAEDFITVLQSLTKRQDLNLLSMARWKKALPDQQLMRPFRAWCSDCLNEFQSRQIIYEPLLWNISVVNVCQKHNKPLSTRCPHPDCNKELPVLERNLQNGYCSKCKRWLGHEIKKKPNLSKEQIKYQVWISEKVGELLAADSLTSSKATREIVSDAIVTCIHRYCAGNISEFGRMMDIPKTTAWSWYAGFSIPSLQNLLKLCGHFNISLIGLLTEGDVEKKKSCLVYVPNCPRYQRTVRKFNKGKIKKRLQNILNNEFSLPLSMEETARTLGYHKRFLYKHFPELSKSISARYLKSVNEQAIKRLRGAREEVRKTTISLFVHNIYPRYQTVEEHLTSPGILREKAVRAAWFETMRELGLKPESTGIRTRPVAGSEKDIAINTHSVKNEFERQINNRRLP